MSKIIKLTSENVKRISAVSITPDGNMVVIGGRNGAGKSSILDSIELALGGSSDVKMPVRKGEEKARIVVDLGDLIVRRVFTATGGSTLVVTDADGVKQTSPQTILDRMVGRLTFDPLEFSRQKPPVQSETLRQLVGLDFTAKDAERETAYNERTAVNREAKQLEARIAGMPKHDGLPETEVTTDAILEEQRVAAEKNAAAAALQTAANQAEKDVKAAREKHQEIACEIREIELQIQSLQERQKLAKSRLDGHARICEEALKASTKAAEAAAAAAKPIPLDQFAARLATAEDTNRKIRANKARLELVAQHRQKVTDAEKLTDRIDRIDAEKKKSIQGAKFPVEGLSFDVAGGGVLFGGIPFDQASSAQQLRVSVAVGLALNPKLKVLLIRDGSLLDEQSLALLAEQAKEADAQIWLEVCTSDAKTAIIIEDGRLATADVVAEKIAQKEML